MPLTSFWPWTTLTSRKRRTRSAFGSGHSAEALETRQLLSAANAAVEPESAAIALAAPETTVWELTFDEQSTYVGTFIQKGKKLTIETAVPELGYIKLKGKVDSENPNVYIVTGKSKVEGTKITLTIGLEFTTETTLVADYFAQVKNETVGSGHITGELTQAAPTPTATPRAAAIESNWTVTLDLVDSDADEVFDAIFQVKPEKKLTVELPNLFSGFVLKGNADRSNPAEYSLKGTKKVPEVGKVRITMELTYLSDDAAEGEWSATASRQPDDKVGTFTAVLDGP